VPFYGVLEFWLAQPWDGQSTLLSFRKAPDVPIRTVVTSTFPKKSESAPLSTSVSTLLEGVLRLFRCPFAFENHMKLGLGSFFVHACLIFPCGAFRQLRILISPTPNSLVSAAADPVEWAPALRFSQVFPWS